eukprot:TRINITY_DN1511_c0_g1_i14.p1 TRINITY_DN1511_c0_g1~~TRINITY_DN1511_c0_g1_i14.p1  ORF type:complete len:360 (+),score=62.00 TRINITY_DN1511_c0_g1_i14:297-1376(+)
MTIVKDMLRDTEVAVCSFMMLRPRFLHPNVASASNTTASTQISGTGIVPSTTTQPMSSSIVPVFEFYSGLPRRPSPFLQNTVTRFEKYLGECKQWIEELEQLLLSDTDDRSSNSDMSLLHSLPKVMSNVHDYFFHVAAKVEGLHQYIESMKTAYLADQRRRGDGNDPFLEADRRETAKQEAAARRVHPTLHLLSISQPSTQVAGLFASSAMPGASSAPQPSSASSASSFSFFTATSSAPSASTSSSFLFSTPSASAPTSTLFGSSFSTQASPLGSSTPLFGSTPTPSLFGSSTPSFASTPATTTPSFFGASTPSFSTPAIGSAPLFSSPFASGAAVGSGASFGAATKSSKPKSRSTRRL